MAAPVIAFAFWYYMEASLKARKMGFVCYYIDALSGYGDVTKLPHRIVIADVTWERQSGEEWAAKLLRSKGDREIDYVHLFGSTLDGEVFRSTFSQNRSIQSIISTSVVWLLNKRAADGLSLWEGSFWTTVDVVDALRSIDTSIELPVEEIIETVSKNVTDGSYDESFGPTCGLCILEHLLGVTKETNGNTTLQWLTKNVSNYSIDEQALYIAALKRINHDVDDALVDTVENAVINGNYSKTAVSINRVLFALTLCEKIDTAQVLINILKQSLKDGWGAFGNAAVVAPTISTLIHYRKKSGKYTEVDPLIFSGIQYIISFFREENGSFSEDCLLTAVSIKTLSLFSEEYPFSIDDLSLDIGTELNIVRDIQENIHHASILGKTLSELSTARSTNAKIDQDVIALKQEKQSLLKKVSVLMFVLGVIFAGSLLYYTYGTGESPLPITANEENDSNHTGMQLVVQVTVPVILTAMLGAFAWWLKKVGLVGKK